MSKYEGDERRGNEKEPWHLDRRVPISLILVILVQTGSVFYWGGMMEQRMGAVEATVNRAPYAMTTTESASAHQILQVQINGNKDEANEIKSWLRSINEKLDRLIERE